MFFLAHWLLKKTNVDFKIFYCFLWLKDDFLWSERKLQHQHKWLKRDSMKKLEKPRSTLPCCGRLLCQLFKLPFWFSVCFVLLSPFFALLWWVPLWFFLFVHFFNLLKLSFVSRPLDKPSSPSRPTVTEITSSSVIVKWNAPDCDGNSPITAYTVECKETGVSQWQAPVPFIATTSTVVDDLTPGSSYQFRVSANNVVGISKPSPPTDPLTLDVGNGK